METLFPEMFPRHANEETFAGEANFACATNVSRGRAQRRKHFLLFFGNVSVTLFSHLRVPVDLRRRRRRKRHLKILTLQ